MRTFFFNLHNDVFSEDFEGRNFENDATARSAALVDARYMAAESVKAYGHLNLDHFIEVLDEDRRDLFKISFGEVVKVIGNVEQR